MGKVEGALVAAMSKLHDWQRRWFVVAQSNCAFYKRQHDALIILEAEWWAKTGAAAPPLPKNSFPIPAIMNDPRPISLSSIKPPPPAHVATFGFSLEVCVRGEQRMWALAADDVASLRLLLGVLKGCYQTAQAARARG